MKFRRKPTIHEAVQWCGDNYAAVAQLTGDKAVISGGGSSLSIPTLEGNMTASKGDWIVRGVNGEFWPVKPDIFALTYEPVP